MDKLIRLIEDRQKLREKIKHLESDLEKSIDEENKIVLYELYLVEKENLSKLDTEINNT